MEDRGWPQLLEQAWVAVAADDDGTWAPAPVEVDVTGTPGHLPSPFAVEEVAVASVGVALLTAAALRGHGGDPGERVSLERGHVADAVCSERFFAIGRRSAGVNFAPLSRFWAAADGWVRTHANYPWHRAALLHALGTEADPDEVAAAMAGLEAEEIEDRVYGAGGIATAVRTVDQWRAHPQGRALAGEPLISHQVVAGPVRPTRPGRRLPLDGVRVVDLTRVIAGPVCTRFLGALGADVIRIDPPHHLDMASGAAGETLLGKRSTFLDFRSPDAAAILERLLSGADVVICGYRPGALDRFGLGAESLAERHGAVVAVYLDAWGHRGPWAGRRGFDSVVQAPTGIAQGQSVDGTEPGALPCQLLDHATGYLAAAAMDGLRRRGTEGGTHIRRLSLARTAQWLTEAGHRPLTGAVESGPDPGPSPWLVDMESAQGPVTVVSPPGALGPDNLRWPFPLTGYGTDDAGWAADRDSARP